MLVVGLTGGISSGKSRVLKMFKDFGCKAIDADEIARQLTEPGAGIFAEIVKKFGAGILNRNGRLNRKRLAKIIFRDKKKRKQLNLITHPRIIAEIKRKIRGLQEWERKSRPGAGKGKRNVFLLDIPLLFEAKLEYLVDKIVLVYVPQRVQIERLRRDDNLTYEEAKARVESQIPLCKKKKYADYIISGNLKPASLRKQVRLLYEELLHPTW